MVASGWVLPPGRGHRAIRSQEAATGSFRVPDPWYDVANTSRQQRRQATCQGAGYPARQLAEVRRRGGGRDHPAGPQGLESRHALNLRCHGDVIGEDT